MVASHRQNRPNLPKDFCPFCPGSGKVPEDYVVHHYPNDFPSLAYPAPDPVVEGTELYAVARGEGVCEVMLYTSNHEGSIRLLSDDHLYELFKMWRRRYEALGQKDFIQYIFIFENKGAVIGVTMPHPHGQLYAYPYIPPRIKTELDSAEAYHQEKGRYLIEDVIAEEKKDGRRVIFENDHIIAFLPFFAEYAYEVHLMPKQRRPRITDIPEDEARALMLGFRDIVGMYDHLFGFELPYIMSMHQAPPKNGYESYHLHMEFCPPHRSRDRLKYNAGSEQGAGAHINPSCPEERAAELREALDRYRAGNTLETSAHA